MCFRPVPFSDRQVSARKIYQFGEAHPMHHAAGIGAANTATAVNEIGGFLVELGNGSGEFRALEVNVFSILQLAGSHLGGGTDIQQNGIGCGFELHQKVGSWEVFVSIVLKQGFEDIQHGL